MVGSGIGQILPVSNNPAREQDSLTDVVLHAIATHGHCKFLVRSNSMAPLIRAGDTIMVKSLKMDDDPTGRVLVYRDGNELVAHRLIGKLGTKCIFHGDASPWADPLQDSSTIVGGVDSITHRSSSLDLTSRRVQVVFAIIVLCLNFQRKLAVILGDSRLQQRREQSVQKLVFRLFRIPIKGLLFFLNRLTWTLAGRSTLKTQRMDS